MSASLAVLFSNYQLYTHQLIQLRWQAKSLSPWNWAPKLAEFAREAEQEKDILLDIMLAQGQLPPASKSAQQRLANIPDLQGVKKTLPKILARVHQNSQLILGQIEQWAKEQPKEKRWSKLKLALQKRLADLESAPQAQELSA
ncbi:hypothetical protein PPO43_00070 [Saprospira sp. CCB-QB6]|uniref:hypothetical protein n=1 Tax=Saprospira sp. CCB-QB6 TaxID=3023936 RepID=UPI00234B1F60|nr:hypothetical protein [Saprospira sp. CCB-QB6]WCL81490.1 hypothetical protein PPO43_00070 [Saprospira sp. CCB-QB6]